MPRMTEHELRHMDAGERSHLKTKILSMIRDNPSGLTIRQIADCSGVSQRYVEELKRSSVETREWKCKGCGGPIKARVFATRPLIPPPYGYCATCACVRWKDELARREAEEELSA